MTAVFAFKKDLLTIQNPAYSSESRDFRCFLPTLSATSAQGLLIYGYYGCYGL